MNAATSRSHRTGESRDHARRQAFITCVQWMMLIDPGSASCYDTKAVKGTRRHSCGAIPRQPERARPADFALLLDGLQAEPRTGHQPSGCCYRIRHRPRSFIVARHARHVQYTRNMAKGIAVTSPCSVDCRTRHSRTDRAGMQQLGRWASGIFCMASNKDSIWQL